MLLLCLGLLDLVHLGLDIRWIEAVHELEGLCDQFGVLVWGTRLGKVNLRNHPASHSDPTQEDWETYHGHVKVVQVLPRFCLGSRNLDLVEVKGPAVPNV